ncbi:MAG: hypothetical protein WAQ98_16150 [Blastocatellia bacterium]
MRSKKLNKISKSAKSNLNKLNQLKGLNAQRGYSLIELAITLILGIIIITMSMKLYLQVIKMYREQQRVMTVEKSLVDVHAQLEESIATLVGRGIISTAVDDSSLPTLFSNGSELNTATGKVEQLKVATVTPSKINNFDAFMVVYSDAATPRLVIGDTTTATTDTGTARVVISSFGRLGSGSGDGRDQFSNNQKLPGSTSSNLPSPNPIKTISPSPIGSSGNPNPPNIPSSSTLSGLPLIPSETLFTPGQPMLLVGGGATRTSLFNTVARLVRLNSVTSPRFTNTGVGDLNLPYLEFSYNLCSMGSCVTEFPGIENLTTSPKTFGLGSLLIPMKTAIFYVRSDEMNTRLIRNDGGVILPNGDGTSRVVGGVETNLGEIDKLNVQYKLADGATRTFNFSTTSPSWLHDITSLNIELKREMPSINNSYVISRSSSLNFPIALKNLND